LYIKESKNEKADFTVSDRGPPLSATASTAADRYPPIVTGVK